MPPVLLSSSQKHLKVTSTRDESWADDHQSTFERSPRKVHNGYFIHFK